MINRLFGFLRIEEGPRFTPSIGQKGTPLYQLEVDVAESAEEISESQALELMRKENPTSFKEYDRLAELPLEVSAQKNPDLSVSIRGGVFQQDVPVEFDQSMSIVALINCGYGGLSYVEFKAVPYIESHQRPRSLRDWKHQTTCVVHLADIQAFSCVIPRFITSVSHKVRLISL